MRSPVWTFGLLVWFLAVTRNLAQDTATAVASVTAGYVTSINLTAPGSGYIEPPQVTISGGGGTGAEGKAILEGDRVALVIVLSAGSGYSSAPSVTDPTGSIFGGSYIVRGGSWTQDASFSRLASRDSEAVQRGSSSLGFRVVLDAAP